MRFQRELAYPAAPADVFAMVSDPAYRKKVGAAQDVVSLDVACTPEGAGVRVVVDQVQKTEGLPAVARKIAGDTTRAILREQWSDPTAGTYQVETPGKPSAIAGTVGIRSDGDGARYVLDLDVAVKVPLVAGKLEKIVAEQFAHRLDVEHAVGLAWLRGER